MNTNPIFDWLFSQYRGVSAWIVGLEIIAVFFGLLSVLLSKKRNIWVYPTGIISTMIFVYLLWVYLLWGDMLINMYYTLMSIYGWISWSRYSQNNIVEVSKTTNKEWHISSILAILSILMVTSIYYLKPFIKNDFSTIDVVFGFEHFLLYEYVDIFTTSVFLVAMWLMAKRKLESWILWIVGDVISVPLYIYKGMYFTSLQYLVFTIIAVFAYFEWKGEFQKQACNSFEKSSK